MRTAFFSLLCVGLFFVSSCGKDDDDTAVELTADNIVGTWNATAFTSDADVEVQGFGASSSSSSITNSTVTIEFKANGTWSSTGDYTLTITDGSDTETEDITAGVGGGTFTVVDGNLTMSGIDIGDESDVDTPVEFNIREFDPNSVLVAFGNVMESGMDPFFGLTFSIDADYNMTLEK